MALVFNPMSCEEPHKPTYEYTPIPKVVECEEEDVCNCECTCNDCTPDSGTQSTSISESVKESVSESVVSSESESPTESESISEAVSESESQVTSESATPTEPETPPFDELKDKLVGYIATVDQQGELEFVVRVVDGVEYYIDNKTGYVYDKTGQDFAIKNSGYSPEKSIGKLYIAGKTVSSYPFTYPPFEIPEHGNLDIDY